MSGNATTTNMEGWRTCPICKGSGINPVATYMVCPKCNGETVVRPVGGWAR